MGDDCPPLSAGSEALPRPEQPPGALGRGLLGVWIGISKPEFAFGTVLHPAQRICPDGFVSFGGFISKDLF